MIRKRKVILLLILVVLCCLTGCDKELAVTGDQVFFQTKDDAGRMVVLKKRPERMVVLSPSFLELLDVVDAKVIGRPNSKVGNIPDSMQAAEEVGFVYNINMEKVVALQPDLVIAGEGMHDKFLSLLESNGIPVLVLRLKTYQDVHDKLLLLSQVVGQGAKGKKIAAEMDDKVKTILDKIPPQAPKIAILHSTAKSVTVQLPNSIAGCTAKMLQLHNVAADSHPLDDRADQTPYSLEKLVELNPDIIFMVTMGKIPELKKKMDAEMASNPAWFSLQAVRDKKIYYLPQELFLLNPGLRYPEAIAYMAKLAYPEVFTDGQ